VSKLSVDKALLKAKSHSKKGEIEEAQKLYQAVLQAFPKNKRAQQGLAALKKPKQPAATQGPPQETINQLLNLYNQGQLTTAIEQANTLTAQYPEAIIVWNILGAANIGLGRVEEASEAFKKVIVLNPNYADGFNNLGLSLQGQGKLEEAIEAYNKALAIKPENAGFYYNMGNALQGKGKLEEAIEAYNKALSIKPDHAESYYNMGNAIQGQGKLEEAIEAYNKALAIKPDYAEAYNNMGNANQGQGKLEEAIEAFNKALAIKPDYADAYNNMGITLEKQGKLEEAIEAYNKTLAIKPDNAEAYNNMGITLEKQGKLEEAIEAYNKALAIKPDYAEAYNNMGNALKDQGKLEEAIEAYSKALAIKPDYAEAYNNMGITLKQQGKLEEAIEAYNKALAIKPDNAEAYNNMGNALKGVVLKQPNPGLQKTITSLLDKKRFVRPSNIARAALSLLKFEPELNRHLQSSAMAEVESGFLTVIKDLSALPLLLKLMSVCPLPDLNLEDLFRELRKSLLSSISDLTGSPDVLEFQSALALQCFTNEYIYNQSEYEDEALTVLEVAVKQVLNKGEQPSPQSILCLASYRPLNQYVWSSSLRMNDEIEDVFTRQVEEPNQEAQLKITLPVLGDITDEVSSKVRDQYEVSPYPRWVNLGIGLKPAPISKVVEEIKLKLFDDKIKEVEAPNILIAGCGTGQHSIGTAARFKGSNVLAIDLSLSSLSYAKRKTEELDIQNIDYMQADILDLGKLGRRFDIVESAGVLHHMDDPFAGWRVLTDCLKPGGLMKIGLYSELARQHIVEMRQEISKTGIGSSDAAMKSFRKTAMKSGQNHHKKILNSSDFYSLSELKDLLFHVQEHRFTIPQIQNCLSQLGLKFCGFESAEINLHFKLTSTGAGDPYDLDKWHKYEETNPGVFMGMYQFWCQKLA